MSSLAKRIMKTTTTTTSSASSRIIGGDEESVDDGGGGGLVFRRTGGPPNQRSRGFDSTASTGDDGDTEDLMEPDLSDTSHMKFVDGRCSCCPYGYHVDLDFLQYLESMNNGDYLNSLKKLHPNKEELKRSLKSYLEQQELARRSNATGAGVPPNVPLHGSPLAPYDRSVVVGGSREILSDAANHGSDITYDKKYTETIELRKVQHHRRHHELDSGSSLSISSGPSSPTAMYPSPDVKSQLHPPYGGRNLTETSMTTTTTTSGTILPKQKLLLELEQQLMEIKPIPPTDQFQHTYVNSSGEFVHGATRFPTNDQDRTTPTNENINRFSGPNQPRPGEQDQREPRHGEHKMRPGRGDQGVTTQGRSEVTTTYHTEIRHDENVKGGQGQHGVRLDQVDMRFDRGELGQENQGDSTEMTRISASTLQAIREQMAACLQRMHEMEEQIKTIPVLQVRNSVLKEEKRMLELQLQSRADRMRSIGVGDFTVDESDLDERSEYSYKRFLQTLSEDERRRLAGSRADTDGTDGDGVYHSTTTMSVGYGVDGELIPVRVHEKELKTEENTEIKEKEVKTVFLGGSGDDVLTADLTGDRAVKAPKLSEKLAKKDVRSIGVGEGNVFDASGGVEVHQKELRTVYIGDAEKHQKSTRNVGILCKPAMRDVGMVHMIDSERPMVRTIAVGVGEIGVNMAEGGFHSGDEGLESGGAADGAIGGAAGGAALQTMNAAMSRLTISSSQSRFLGLKSDQLRSLLDEALKRTVHSVAVQCNFNTEDKAIDAARVGYEMVDVACSDDVIDVDVVPIRHMKSVAIDNRPSLFHRACGTDAVHKLDMATNTQTMGIHHHRATNTETAVTYPASTNTEDPVRANAAVGTEQSVFFALQQLMNTGTNTNIQEFWNVGLNTDLSGDVQELVIKPEQRDNSVNTITSSVKVWDKMTSTVPSQRVEKAVNTTGVPQFERGINTEKQRVSVAAVNTDRAATMSRGVDCNIVQSENKSFLEEGMQSSRSSDVSRSFRTTVEAAEPLERSGIRTTITQQREIIPSNSGFRQDFETTDSRTGDNQEFKEVTVSGGSGGRTTTTRVVKSFTRGGRSDFSDDLPTSDIGFRNIANVDSGILSSGGSSSSSTRTVTRVTGGGHSEIVDDFPETSVKEQVGGAESRSSYQTTTTSVERPGFEEEFGFGSLGGRGTVARTVTTIHGGRSGLMEDIPAHEIGLQRSEREIDSSGMEGPDFGDSFGTGRSGGRAFTTRTVRAITRGGGGGGRSEIVQEFPTGDISFRDDGQEHFGVGAADGSTSNRTVTSRTATRTYHGGSQLDDSDGYGLGSRASSIMARSGGTVGGSHLLGRMDEDFSRLQGQYGDIAGGSASGLGGYGSSRTVIKRTSGDPDDPECWTEETWVTEGPGDDSASRQMISSSQSAAVEIPEHSSTMSEMRVEHQRSGQLLSSGMIMSEEPLRSIMKTGRQGDHSSDQIALGRKGISFFDSSTSKYEANQELQSAFKLYDDWLEDSTRVTAQQLNSSLSIIQNSWFKVSSHKTSSSSQVEGFLNMIHSLSPDLMRQVINMADANGNTVLHYAASNCNMDVVSLLLNTGICDINHQNKTGCTAVMMAALTEVKSEQQREVVRKLFEMGDVNIQAPADGNELAGQTALMLAVSHGRLDMVKMLLEVGADINLQDDDGSTALMVAAEHGHVDIARLLLAHPECDAFLKDKDGSSAASIAREGGRQSIVSLLNAHINSRGSKPESRMASLHKARKVVTRITLSSPTEMS